MVVAYVLIRVNSGKEDEVLATVERRGEVKEAGITYGAYDLVAKVEVGSPEELDTFIFDVLRRIPEVNETTTLITSRMETGSEPEQ